MYIIYIHTFFTQNTLQTHTHTHTRCRVSTIDRKPSRVFNISNCHSKVFTQGNPNAIERKYGKIQYSLLVINPLDLKNVCRLNITEYICASI